MEKLSDEVGIGIDIEGSKLFIEAYICETYLSIKDVRDLITELNELHTQMNINHHKELLDNKKK